MSRRGQLRKSKLVDQDHGKREQEIENGQDGLHPRSEIVYLHRLCSHSPESIILAARRARAGESSRAHLESSI